LSLLSFLPRLVSNNTRSMVQIIRRSDWCSSRELDTMMSPTWETNVRKCRSKSDAKRAACLVLSQLASCV